ncbi:hypothetical protein KPZU09_57920 [Klebsiella pneumoniae]|uniref:Uncharacterized protein n=1 Tax=Klebsiella pneumoniae TaxID=573 RepID=A0A919I563_KLEPN|nr:hypothetical protein KPZU09_57920 [Klebsiella pneumoniae]
MKAFCVEHEDDVSFYLWLQWLAWSQFAACWETSQRDGMPIGLYRDRRWASPRRVGNPVRS